MGCIQSKKIILSKSNINKIDLNENNKNQNNINNSNNQIYNHVYKKNTITYSNSGNNQDIVDLKKIATCEKIKIKNMISKSDTCVEDNYKILKQLGKGSFGSVFKVLQIETGLIRAMKVIKKESLSYQDDDQKFLKEIEILIGIEHPNIIKIYEYYTDEIYYYLITEFLSGGELYDTISTWDSFDEGKAAYILLQILSSVNYLHSLKIVHRDIKPENMLVENRLKNDKNDELINIKLIDFGTCNYYDCNKSLTLRVGSPYYIAPEVLKRKYNEKCDIWSCGVILYLMLVGISAQEAIEHPWIVYVKKKEITNIDKDYFSSVLKNIKNFNAKEKLQQATIAYIVHFIYSSKEIEGLKKVFKYLDKNGDGRLTYGELRSGFDRVFGRYLSDIEMNKVIEEVDGDNDGYISYEEFLRVATNRKKLLEEKNLKLAFDRFDLNRDGILSREEVKKVLGTNENHYINLLLSSIDKNKDGFISFSEFCDLMNGVVDKTLNSLKDSENNDNLINNKNEKDKIHEINLDGNTKDEKKEIKENKEINKYNPNTIYTKEINSPKNTKEKSKNKEVKDLDDKGIIISENTNIDYGNSNDRKLILNRNYKNKENRNTIYSIGNNATKSNSNQNISNNHIIMISNGDSSNNLLFDPKENLFNNRDSVFVNNNDVSDIMGSFNENNKNGNFNINNSNSKNTFNKIEKNNSKNFSNGITEIDAFDFKDIQKNPGIKLLAKYSLDNLKIRDIFTNNNLDFKNNCNEYQNFNKKNTSKDQKNRKNEIILEEEKSNIENKVKNHKYKYKIHLDNEKNLLNEKNKSVKY